jgi:hypothetical protein
MSVFSASSMASSTLDAGVTGGAVDSLVPPQQLDGEQIAGAPVDQHSLRRS